MNHKHPKTLATVLLSAAIAAASIVLQFLQGGG